MIEQESLDPSGLVLTGATITGQLDLSDVVAKKPLVLRNCTTEGLVLLSRAHFSTLDLQGLVAPGSPSTRCTCASAAASTWTRASTRRAP